MSRRHLYSVELERPSRRYGEPRPLRLSLRWDGHQQAYVHTPTGATLEGLIYAAKKRGHSYSLEYPAPQRCTFSVQQR